MRFFQFCTFFLILHFFQNFGLLSHGNILRIVERVANVPTDGTDQSPEVCIIELGGTIGDIESMHFVEAFRQFEFRIGSENFLNMHVSLVPTPSSGNHSDFPSKNFFVNTRFFFELFSWTFSKGKWTFFLGFLQFSFKNWTFSNEKWTFFLNFFLMRRWTF